MQVGTDIKMQMVPLQVSPQIVIYFRKHEFPLPIHFRVIYIKDKHFELNS